MIAIPNMEVPKSCEDCQFLSLDGVVTDDNEWVSYEICEVTEQLIKEDITCPLIDIVTCGECKYYEESEYIEGDMVCKYHIGHTYYTEADRYCYYGERNSKNNSNQI